MNITVIGCGHGGQALAAHLSLLGHCVTLYADAQHPGDLHGIHDNRITLSGRVIGISQIAVLTTDCEQAVHDADVIYLSLPTHAHLSQFKKILPFLVNGQVIVALAGNFSSLYMHQAVEDNRPELSLYIADTASLPYACRAHRPGRVEIIEIKNQMPIASMPARDTSHVRTKLKGHFPCTLQTSSNVLELGLNITSAISHPIIMITNAGRIGSGQPEFYFYKEGISPESANIIHALDRDRIDIGRRYGLQLHSYLDSMNGFYGQAYDSYHDFFTHSPVHNALKLCPPSVRTRYLTQDIPYVMLPWFSLGRHVGYESHVMKSLIDLSSLLNDTCYLSNGRNVADDFFVDKSVDDINRYLMQGV